MPLSGNMTENDDKTKNYSINAVKEINGGKVLGSLHVQGYRDSVDPTRINAPPYNVANASLGIANNDGHSVNISGQHIPNFGNRVMTSANANILKTDNHQLDVNASSATTIPKSIPNFQTHGVGIDYAFKDKFGANASVSHTPAFQATDYSIGGKMNLHQTPNSSLNLNVGANRQDTAFGRGDWNKNAFIEFKKSF
ncbi:attacin antimicrobial protein [Danaus plexippus plexippus]|uniref:Attacin antimicrobial protein n=1 Tax=Danaus plexippus plexippus TaxID=278856 RepID=A0A212FFC0_DANPL|nr:attacin antimicrobial protein [Danaus plexippus plexippus]